MIRKCLASLPGGRFLGSNIARIVPLRSRNNPAASSSNADATCPVGKKACRDDDLIDPDEMVARLGIPELCRSADGLFRAVTDPTTLMSKPFSCIHESYELLYRLSLMISGLRLGKSMVIMDFGAGTCWLSRILNQMQCITISVDPSTSALEIGKKLFLEHPIIGAYLKDPVFLPFDGYQIDLPDESVDRIVCFDSFHHVPNPETVLKEFYRTLKPGGIVGFSEPGRHHSRSPQSQYEMRNFGVLERDIDPFELVRASKDIGFSDAYFKLVGSPALDLDCSEYTSILESGSIPKRVAENCCASMSNSTILFLVKGDFVPDSRTHTGLKHEMKILSAPSAACVGEPVAIRVRVKNTGSSKWLHSNIAGLCVVNLGIHLYDGNSKLINLDFHRTRLGDDVLPGQEVELSANISFDRPGKYMLCIDLVDEAVCWFENMGSTPKFVSLAVKP